MSMCCTTYKCCWENGRSKNMGQSASTSSNAKTARLASIDEGFEPANSHKDNGGNIIIQLNPVQSCNLHGWSNPKRTLSWEDVASSQRITFMQCLAQGLEPEQLHEMQPSIQHWIRQKRVSFTEVPYMTCWPLHPIMDLKGDISDLATMHYSGSVLRKLGITYRYMREELRMDDDWMRMLRYRPNEWKACLGFDEACASEMGEARVQKVFLMDMGMLKVAMNAP